MLLWATALAADLSGTVLGADGTAAVGATVTAYDLRFNYASATTRTDGQWDITGLPAGTYRVRVQPQNADPSVDAWLGDTWAICDSTVVAVGEDETLDALDVNLELGASIEGNIVDADGNPAAGALVQAVGLGERAAAIDRYGLSDANGGYKIVGLDADNAGSSYVIKIQIDGWPDQFLGSSYTEVGATPFAVLPQQARTDGDGTLQAGILVEGTVSSADGPVSSGTVYVYSASQVLVGALGLGGEYVADGLPPGDVVAWASSAGFATTYFPDSDRPGDSVPVSNEGDVATLDFVLPPDNPITFNFSGEGDFSAVSLLVYNDTYTVGRGAGLGADGSVQLTGFYPGNYLAYVFGDDGGFASGFLTDDQGEPELFAVEGPTSFDRALAPGATIAGIVTDDAGIPVFGATITASETGGEERQWSAVTDRDGKYEIRGLAGATVEVLAQWYWYCPNDPGWVDTWFDAARSSDGAALMQVVAGENYESVDFIMPRDNDHDNMGDVWEAENGLDPSVNDADGDADGDGYTNWEEWVLDTDPTGEFAVGECGCVVADTRAWTSGLPWVVCALVASFTDRNRRFVRGAAQSA